MPAKTVMMPWLLMRPNYGRAMNGTNRQFFAEIAVMS
jgi:hypothetical protein